MYCKKCGSEIHDNENFCHNCGAKIDTSPTKPSFEDNVKKKHAPAFYIVMIIMIIIFAVAIFIATKDAFGGFDENKATTHSVTYKISGSAQEANLTYMNDTGETDQITKLLPFDINFDSVKEGEFLSIIAQNEGVTGSITCEIWVDGKLFKDSTSSGKYAVASCDGLLE